MGVPLDIVYYTSDEIISQCMTVCQGEINGVAPQILDGPPRIACSAGRAPSPRTGAMRLPPNPLSRFRGQAVTVFSGGWGRLSGPGCAGRRYQRLAARRSCPLCARPCNVRSLTGATRCGGWAGGRGWGKGGGLRCVRARLGAPAGVGAGPLRPLRQGPPCRCCGCAASPLSGFRLRLLRAARLRRRSGPCLLGCAAPRPPARPPLLPPLFALLCPASRPLWASPTESGGYRQSRAAPTAAAEGATQEKIMTAGSRLSRVETSRAAALDRLTDADGTNVPAAQRLPWAPLAGCKPLPRPAASWSYSAQPDRLRARSGRALRASGVFLSSRCGSLPGVV